VQTVSNVIEGYMVAVLSVLTVHSVLKSRRNDEVPSLDAAEARLEEKKRETFDAVCTLMRWLEAV